MAPLVQPQFMELAQTWELLSGEDVFLTMAQTLFASLSACRKVLTCVCVCVLCVFCVKFSAMVREA